MAAPKKVAAKLAEGDWVDVLDNVGVWNVAQVLAIKSSSSVCVRYDGWGADYDEDVDLGTGRIAPYHTYTWTVKCWAKYLNWPWWPCVTTVRAPGNEAGMAHLRTEMKLYCDFLDTPQPDKRFRSWIQKSKVVPYDDHFNMRRKHTSGRDFEDALLIMLQSNATTKFPTFVRGTLPKQYKDGPTEHALKTKKSMGELWVRSFANNRKRHADAHAYKYQDGSKPKARHEVDVTETKKPKASQKSPVPVAAAVETNTVSPPFSQEMLVVRTDIILDSDEDEDKILRSQVKRVRRISPGANSKQKVKQQQLSRQKEIDPTDEEDDDDAHPIARRISPRINGKLKEEPPKQEAMVDDSGQDDEDDNVILRPRVRRTRSAIADLEQPGSKPIIPVAKATTANSSSAKGDPAKQRTKASRSHVSSATKSEVSEERKISRKRVLSLSTGSAETSSINNQWLEIFNKGVSQVNGEDPPRQAVKKMKTKISEVPSVSDTDAPSAALEYQEESDSASVESLGVADSWDNARNHSFLVLDYEKPNVVETEKLKTSKKSLQSKRSRSSSSEIEVDYTPISRGGRIKVTAEESMAKKPRKSKSLIDQQIYIALGNLDDEKPRKPSSKSSKSSRKLESASKEAKTAAKSNYVASALNDSEVTSRVSKKSKKPSVSTADAASENKSGPAEKPMIFFRPPSKFDDSLPTSKTRLYPTASSASAARPAQDLEGEFLRHCFDSNKDTGPPRTLGIHSARHIGPSRLIVDASDRSPRRLLVDASRRAGSSAEFSMSDWFQGRMCAKFLG